MKLSNGLEIPEIGFGTWQTPDGRIVVRDVKQAIRAGYRLIDTSAAFGNENGIGQAVRESDVPREELFITSKVWTTDRGYDATLRAFDASLERFQLDFLDLYLIHWPDAKTPQVNIDTWRALERIYSEGRVRAIGVSNFLPHHLLPVWEAAETKPMVNQIEFHPGYLQPAAVVFCRTRGIVVQGWSPLGSGKLIEKPILTAIAKNHRATAAQVCLRWSLQHGIIPLPKAETPAQMYQNLDLDFTLSPFEMQTIDAIEPNGGFAHPDHVNF